MTADVNVTEKVARAEAERRYASPAHYGRAEIQAFIAGALWHRARGADFGPAPVVPDSLDVRERVRRAVKRAATWTEDGPEYEEAPDAGMVEEITDAVLAVVGQDVTAQGGEDRG